jgi:hypothetical protein
LPAITTKEQNSLAVAVQGFTDNSNPNAAPGGTPTGGTWAISAQMGTTSADDARLVVSEADLASPGTISGGALTFNETTPTRSLSLTVGFALRGKPA